MFEPSDSNQQSPDRVDLTARVGATRRGLRRDVAALLDDVDRADLFVPLASPIPGARPGEAMRLEDDLSLEPHMLADDDGHLFAALFTRPDILEPLGRKLGWTTAEDDLEYCALPARVALELALGVIDEDQVLGLVLNAGHDSELVLMRSELASIVKGKAVPLVAYIRHIPMQDFEKTLVTEDDEPAPPELTRALSACLDELGSIERHILTLTFNPDRDLEPHLTLTLTPRSRDVDFESVTRRIMEAVADHVPPPGYIDILFDPPNGAGA